MVRLGELGIAHGPIDGDTVVIRPDGHPAIGNFGGAKVAATDAAVMTDRAQLLVSTALLVGHERAVSAAAQALDADGLARVIPFVQPAVARPRRHAAPCTTPRGSSTRSGTWPRARPGSTLPKLEQVRRVTVGSVVKVVLIGLLAYWLIASLAGVDITQIVDELKSADTVWLWAALLLVPFVQVAQAFSTIGASHPPGPLRPGADARVRDPVHRARGAQLGGPGRAGDPVLPARAPTSAAPHRSD